MVESTYDKNVDVDDMVDSTSDKSVDVDEERNKNTTATEEEANSMQVATKVANYED